MTHALFPLLADLYLLPVTLCAYLPSCYYDLGQKRQRNAYPPVKEHAPVPPAVTGDDVYKAWLDSRNPPRGSHTDRLPPGALRPCNSDNIRRAYFILASCICDTFGLLWRSHPNRIAVSVVVDVLRGVLPALRGYSQARIVDEAFLTPLVTENASDVLNQIQSSISNGTFDWSRVSQQFGVEFLRMGLETALDHVASSSEHIVHSSAKYIIEYRQLEQRLRLDIPTMNDPNVRDLLQESDIFVRSFNGMSAFGIISPIDFMRILALSTELIAHMWILASLTFGSTPSVVLYSLIFTALPTVFTYFTAHRSCWDGSDNMVETRLTMKQDAMRRLAHSDSHRAEVILFGLGPWMLRTWSKARRSLLGLQNDQPTQQSDILSQAFSRLYLSGLFSSLENVPLLLVLRSSSTSLGSFTLYQRSLQGFFLTLKALCHTLRMAFQGIFFMGAFYAATHLRPQLQPPPEKVVKFQPSGRGVKIEVRGLSYRYHGGTDDVLRDVNLTVESGETLAIVGYNGSGKSTLAKILLRILDFDRGALLVNGTDARRLRPADYHEHATAVFQDFAKFSASARANVGIGFVPDLRDDDAVQTALGLAGAADLVRGLPRGLKTRLGAEAGLDADGSEPGAHGLSGGEWQRIAISRAFMRARRPETELLVFDEPTSALDAHAQNRVFDTIRDISRAPSGERTKTVVFITHRLATARRADKIAMMENGTISEFGTHQELLARDGAYAALYHASV